MCRTNNVQDKDVQTNDVQEKLCVGQECDGQIKCRKNIVKDKDVYFK